MKLRVAEIVIPRTGENVSGDRIVLRQENGRYLIGVIDALGHGQGASEVAKLAAERLDKVDLTLRPAEMMSGVDHALSGTRGAAAMICVIEGDRIEGCGVGNVTARLSGGEVPILLSPGILGAGVSKIRTFEGTLWPGIRVAVFSDGFSTRLSLTEVRHLSPPEAIKVLVDRYRRSHDDASMVVADLEMG